MSDETFQNSSNEVVPKRQSSRNTRRFLAIVLIMLLLIASLFVAGRPYIPQHSILRTDQLGASLLAQSIPEVLGATVSRYIISPLTLESYPEIKILVIIGASRKYTPSELDAYHRFVSNGGTLLIFEDFGNARDVANKFGISFSKGVIRETNPYLYTNSPDKPIIFEQFISSLIEPLSINPIQLNRATAVYDVLGFLTLTTFPILYYTDDSSAFLDINDNNQIDSSDRRAPLPVGVLKPVEDGYVIVIGDATLPLNLYWQQKGKIANTEFVYGNAIYTLLLLSFLMALTGSQSVVFDESHLNPQINSLIGLTSWMIGLWVGLSYADAFNISLALIVGGLGLARLRKIRLRRERGVKVDETGVEQLEFVSHPTHAERLLSEYFILYQIMKGRIFHVGNFALLDKIEETTKDTTLRQQLESSYGNLTQVTSLQKLIEINSQIHEYIRRNERKWL